MNLQNQISKTEKIWRELDKLRDQIQYQDKFNKLLVQLLSKTDERLWRIEERIHQLESKNNPQPKLSIEKIPPISFLSK